MVSLKFRQLCYIFLLVSLIVAASTILALEAEKKIN